MKSFIAYHLHSKVDFGNVVSSMTPREPEGSPQSITYIIPSEGLHEDEKQSGKFILETDDGFKSFTVARKERILPASSVREHLAEKSAKFKRETGYDAKPIQKQEWKHEFIERMLPHCPIKKTKTKVLFSIEHKLMLVGTASQKVADSVISYLLLQTGNLLLSPFSYLCSSSFLTKVLMEDDGRASLYARLENRSSGEKITFADSPSLTDAITAVREHPNIVVKSLGFEVDDFVYFVLNDKGIVSSIELASHVDDASEDSNDVIDDYVASQYIFNSAALKIVDVLREMEEYSNDDNDL